MEYDNTESNSSSLPSSDFDQFAPIIGNRIPPGAYRSSRDKLAVYKIWAPDNALWTEWAKPVLFASSSQWKDFQLEIPEINWLTSAQPGTMVIVDLPGKTGVEESLALARLGFRPVPLYNGVYNEKYSMLVSVKDVVDALYRGADVLETLNVRPDAPPVFMLDSNRMDGGKEPGKYDNRWSVFPQDMPSAAFLSERRIDKVIVRSDSDKVRDDLLHILRRYQEQNIKMLHSVGDQVTDMTVPKPSRFKGMFYRFKVILGLTRNAAGGFGGQIPEPSSGSG